MIEEPKAKPSLIRTQNREATERDEGGDLTAKGLSSAGVAQLILSCVLSSETGLPLLIARSPKRSANTFSTCLWNVEHSGVHVQWKAFQTRDRDGVWVWVFSATAPKQHRQRSAACWTLPGGTHSLQEQFLIIHQTYSWILSERLLLLASVLGEAGYWLSGNHHIIMQYAAEIATSFALIIYMTLVITGCSFLLVRFRMRWALGRVCSLLSASGRECLRKQYFLQSSTDHFLKKDCPRKVLILMYYYFIRQNLTLPRVSCNKGRQLTLIYVDNWVALYKVPGNS